MANAIGVHKVTYTGRQAAPLQSLSFSVAEDGIHGIFSPYGNDASTLLAILSGALPPSSGALTRYSEAVDLSSDTWKRDVGYVPATPDFYGDMTVVETLEFVGVVRGISEELRVRQIEEALELVGLASLERRLVKRLTKTEKKRLSFAAALLGNPDVLLIDGKLLEHLSRERKEFCDLIRMLGGLKTVLLSSGDFSLLRELCEDVVILANGTLIAQGSFDELESNLRSADQFQSLDELIASLETLVKEDAASLKRGGRV